MTIVGPRMSDSLASIIMLIAKRGTLHIMGERFEEYVASLLGNLGYSVLGSRVKVESGGIEVGEVDLLVMDPAGVKYAVEVKSGRVDVSGIRQAYTNAVVLGVKPMVVARGFSNDSASQLANELGVKVITLAESVVLGMDELRLALIDALYQFVAELIEPVGSAMRRGVSMDLIDALIECNSIDCICNKLNMNDCSKIMESLKDEFNVNNASLRKLRVLAFIYKLFMSATGK